MRTDNDLEELAPEDVNAALEKTGLDLVLAANASPGDNYVQAAHGSSESYIAMQQPAGTTVWVMRQGTKQERRERYHRLLVKLEMEGLATIQTPDGFPTSFLKTEP